MLHETPQLGVTYEIPPDVVTISQPRSLRAESIRTLRTHIMAQHIADGRRGLAICAASPAVGATFTAVNLAVALAQVGVKVLLIDADLRNPQVQDFIRPSSAPAGLKQYLEGTSDDLSKCIAGQVIDNLSVMYAGGFAGDAQELLASDRFEFLLKRCLRDYDLTIVDTPPANSCADARRITKVVGYGVIVARQHTSYINDLKTLASQLREDRAQVVGTVLTAN